MDHRSGQLARFLFSRPSTWLALAILAGLHGLFAWWFQPPLPMHALAFLVELCSLAFGFRLTVRSPAFGRFVDRMPFEDRDKELARILPGCTPRFRELAGACRGMVRRIREEFREQHADAELGAIVGNLVRLANANRELVHRSESFGTAEQKASMQRMLERQVSSLEMMEGHLRAFSGNLALIEAKAEETPPAEGLRFINQGLEDALKELDHG
jgi:hypothetical protein